jgi:hypothetical protein
MMTSARSWTRSSACWRVISTRSSNTADGQMEDSGELSLILLSQKDAGHPL